MYIYNNNNNVYIYNNNNVKDKTHDIYHQEKKTKSIMNVIHK